MRTPCSPSLVAAVLAAIALGVAPASVAGCADYDAPPEPSIAGLNNGTLANARAPIVITFSKPPVQSTVSLQLVQLGNNDNCFALSMPLDVLFSHDPVNGDVGGQAVFSADGLSLTITLVTPPPVAATLAVLMAPHLKDAAGTETNVQRCLPFGYAATLTCNAAASVFGSGTYFLLTSVSVPIQVQIQLFGAIDVDPATGELTGAFTKAKRNPDPSRCSPPCDATTACRTLPGPPACVVPSTPAGTVDEFPDYVPNLVPENGGFTFNVTGCTVDQDPTTATFATAPTDVDVTSPNVTLRNAALSASFTAASGILRGTGALTADDVLLGTINNGPGMGDVTGRSITASQAPPNIPQPDAGPGEAGAP
jgi:hypothetical protein